MDERIAIVGMEAVFGADEGLDALDRTIFDGLRHSVAKTPRRKKTRAGTKSESKEDFTLLLNGSAGSGESSLLRMAVDGALRESRHRKRANPWKHLALILVAGEDLPLEGIEPPELFRVDSCLRALASVPGLLADGRLRGVLIAAVDRQERTGMSEPVVDKEQAEQPLGNSVAGPLRNRLSPGDGACAVLLRRYDQAKKDGDRVYALIEAFATGPAGATKPIPGYTEGVVQVCGEAFRMSGLDPAKIGYLEMAGESPEESGPELIRGLTLAYSTGREALTCALGSLQANLSRSSQASALASLVKASLCLYHRYIPAMPGWGGPRYPENWQESPFYVAGESRPWFLDSPLAKRSAAIQRCEGSALAHLILSEEPGEGLRENRYLKVVSPYCFPLAGDHPEDLRRQLADLVYDIGANRSLVETARENLSAFQGRRAAAYALMIVGHTREELRKEIDFLQARLPEAAESGSELKTPKGSYFTAKPLGAKGSVAFVYPGVGSAYVGLGHATFHLFPELYEPAFRLSPNLGESLREKELYPRSREPLTEDEIWKRELKLRKDIQSIGEGGMGFFVLYTMILRDIFKVVPEVALGYSLGEPGMIASLGVWEEPARMADTFRRSPIFRERLHGRLAAVRELWGTGPGNPGPGEKIWDSYTLQATPETVRNAIGRGDRAYLTIINAPNEVVIAGDPESCMRVIKRIGCKHFPLGLHLAIHCDPARLEYDGLVDLYTLPTVKVPGIKFYSSSCYKSIPIRSKAVAHSIAKAFCEPVDFPRLVRQVYEDGARIFIELGSRKFCSHLIDRILPDRDHLAMAVNVKGTRDESSLVRVLAQLVGHRVPVDLTPLI